MNCFTTTTDRVCFFISPTIAATNGDIQASSLQAGQQLGSYILSNLKDPTANTDTPVTQGQTGQTITGGLGYVVKGAVENVFQQELSYLPANLRSGAASAVSGVLTKSLGQALGTGTFFNTGVAGLIGQIGGPIIDSALQSYGIMGIPPAITSAAAGLVGGQVVNRILNNL